MSTPKTQALTLFAALILFATGCSHRFYGLTLYNDSSDRISDSRITYGARVLEYGNVVPHASRGYGTVRLPIPDTALVSWTHDSGKSFERSVAIRKFISKPKSFAGHIDIHLQNDGTAFTDVRE
jgi:hypothetical protein